MPSLSWLISRVKSNENEIANDENKNNNQSVTTTTNETDKSYEETLETFDVQVLTYVRTIEQQLQYVLRMLAKLCLTKLNKECDNISEIYKSLYSQTLKSTQEGDWRSLLSCLLNVLNAIKSSNVKLTSVES